jgi:L-alanine-DL-glutamate epimerase-like enolase superfamily enzyme
VRIAGGEQDASNVMFSQMVAEKTYHILQPDVFYAGKLLKLAYIYHLAKGMGWV